MPKITDFKSIVIESDTILTTLKSGKLDKIYEIKK